VEESNYNCFQVNYHSICQDKLRKTAKNQPRHLVSRPRTEEGTFPLQFRNALTKIFRTRWVNHMDLPNKEITGKLTTDIMKKRSTISKKF
jgi:hypothetical protein